MKKGGGYMKLISAFLILFSLIFSGCGTIKVIDKNESDLMPKSVAMGIFEKYGFRQWAENPFLVNMGSFCGTEKEYIEFNQIEYAHYLRIYNRLEFQSNQREKRFFCPVLHVFFDNVTEPQALELTNAARALGATKIDRLKWAY